jgi:hypothetical protein
MDPDAALKDLLDAVCSRDWDRTEELADGLLTWMEKRGFPPLTLGPKELGRDWHRSVATFVCYAAQSKVQDARKRRKKKEGSDASL